MHFALDAKVGAQKQAYNWSLLIGAPAVGTHAPALTLHALRRTACLIPVGFVVVFLILPEEPLLALGGGRRREGSGERAARGRWRRGESGDGLVL